MSDFIRADSIDLQTLHLTNIDNSRAYDLSAQVIEFSIYEDILFPVIRAEFTIIDSLGILTGFPIIGEEFIYVEFTTPGFDLVNSYKFHVKSIDNQVITSSSKTQSYVIRAYSHEFMANAVQFVSQRYTAAPEEIIQSILQNNLLTTKSIAVEQTKGTQDVLISRLRPFQAIDMIRKRSVSLKYVSSSYVFFENKRGFNFCTIEFLLDQLQNNINDKIFYYDTVGPSDIRNMNSRNILSMRNVSQVNNTKKLTAGSLNNIVKRFDIVTGQTAVFNYVNAEQQQKFKFAEKTAVGLNSSTFEDTYGKSAAQSLLVPHSTALPETFIADTMGAKHSFVTKMAQNIYHVHVNGDTALTAGDVITINVPAPTGATGPQEDNRLTSGNYLISKLRHIVYNPSAGQKSYTCSMELIRGIYGDNT